MNLRGENEGGIYPMILQLGGLYPIASRGQQGRNIP